MSRRKREDNVKQVTWFTQLNNHKVIGIVICQDRGETMGFIGCADGCDQKQDIKHILETGGRVHYIQAKEMMQALDQRNS